MLYFVKFRQAHQKRSKLVAKIAPNGDVIPTGLRIHASRFSKDAADKLVAAIQGAGWHAEVEPIQ